VRHCPEQSCGGCQICASLRQEDTRTEERARQIHGNETAAGVRCVEITQTEHFQDILPNHVSHVAAEQHRGWSTSLRAAVGQDERGCAYCDVSKEKQRQFFSTRPEKKGQEEASEEVIDSGPHCRAAEVARFSGDKRLASTSHCTSCSQFHQPFTFCINHAV